MRDLKNKLDNELVESSNLYCVICIPYDLFSNKYSINLICKSESSLWIVLNDIRAKGLSYERVNYKSRTITTFQKDVDAIIELMNKYAIMTTLYNEC